MVYLRYFSGVNEIIVKKGKVILLFSVDEKVSSLKSNVCFICSVFIRYCNFLLSL